MMSKIELKELYSNMQKEMETKLSTGASAFTHPGTKGDEVEANWIEWLKNYLPKRYAVNKGIIIDSNGEQSEQIDIVVYDAQYSYLVFHHNDSLLIPAESVYAVFEVKPSLNKKNMDYAGEKAMSVRNLRRTSAPIKHAGGKYSPKPLHEIIAGILTTRSDWTEPIARQIVKNLQDREPLTRLDIVSSISNGTFVMSNNALVDEYNENGEPMISSSNKDESLIFLLLNLLKKLQDIGTVPAIDFEEYMKTLTVYKNK